MSLLTRPFTSRVLKKKITSTTIPVYNVAFSKFVILSRVTIPLVLIPNVLLQARARVNRVFFSNCSEIVRMNCSTLDFILGVAPLEGQ